MSCEAAFLQQLRKRGLRMTPQREMVLSVMHQTDAHIPVDEIYRRVCTRTSAVDISTVYRTLDLLSEMKMLAIVEMADGQRLYALAPIHGHHLHLMCRGCGRAIEAEMQPVEALAEELWRSYGFALDLAHLSLSGLCRECEAGAVATSQGVQSPADRMAQGGCPGVSQDEDT